MAAAAPAQYSHVAASRSAGRRNRIRLSRSATSPAVSRAIGKWTIIGWMLGAQSGVIGMVPPCRCSGFRRGFMILLHLR